MGWLYMQSLKGHSGPRQYLDAQFTFERPEATSKVAALGARRHARLLRRRGTDHFRDRRARGLGVDLSRRYNPRDREGYIFGYKDMTVMPRAA